MAQLNDLIVNGNTRFLNSAYGNLVGWAASALYAPASSHNHDYKLSAGTAALSISGGISLSANGSNISITSGDHKILISAKNNWTANAKNVAGYVTGPSAGNLVWKTDANGNPGWNSESFQATAVRTQTAANGSAYSATTAMFSGASAKTALKAGEAISATYAFSSYYNFGSNLYSNSAYNFTGNQTDSDFEVIPWTALNSGTNAIAYLRNVVLGKNNIAYKRNELVFRNNINVTETFEPDPNASNPFILMGNWNTAAGGGTCIGVKGSAWNGGVTLGVARRESPALAYNCALAIKGSAWDGSFSLGKSTANSGSFSLGSGNSANSDSFSLGSGNSASLNSLAFGINNKANTASLSFGTGNSASIHSLAFGTNNSATNYSMANGLSSKADQCGFSLGYKTSAYTNSIAVGSAALATNNSIAVGEYVTASLGGATFGKYNLRGNGLLVIGNGTSTQRSDILFVDSTQVSASKLNTPVLKNERFEHNVYTDAKYNAGAASALKEMWANLPQSSYKFAYTNNGIEYTYLLSKSPSATSSRYWGTILAWTYEDKWPKILRYKSSAWQSNDWEKICVPKVENNVLIFG